MYLNEDGRLIDTNKELVKGNVIANLLDQYGLNWEVKKVPLVQAGNGNETRFFGTVREDTQETFQCFTNQYSIYQNSELAEIVLGVANELNATETNCGMFKGGARVYMQIGMSDKYVGKDRVKRWANGLNSFDGSTSLRWGAGNQTISCSNIFTPQYMKNALSNSVKHTTNMREAVAQSLKIIETLEAQEETLFEVFNRMATVKATTKQVHETIKLVTGVDVTMTESAARKVYSTRKINNGNALTQSILKEMSYKEQTLWGLFSGVTHFTTHVAGSDAIREESKMMGTLNNVDQKVFNELAAIIA